MKKIQWSTLLLAFLLSTITAYSQGSTTNDWENEQVIGINKEAARAHSNLYATVQQASEDHWLNSPYLLDLNGTWSFNWVKHPDLRPVDFYLTDYDVSYWDEKEIFIPMN